MGYQIIIMHSLIINGTGNEGYKPTHVYESNRPMTPKSSKPAIELRPMTFALQKCSTSTLPIALDMDYFDMQVAEWLVDRAPAYINLINDSYETVTFTETLDGTGQGQRVGKYTQCVLSCRSNCSAAVGIVLP